MQLQLTEDSKERFLEAARTVENAGKLQISYREQELLLHCRKEPKIYPCGLAIIKLPKYRADSDQWYHLIHMRSLLCIGRVQYDGISDARKIFEQCKWYYLASDETRRTLVAVVGNLKMHFHCNLQYEIVDDENT